MNSPDRVTRTDQGTSSSYVDDGVRPSPTMCCGFRFSMTTLMPLYVGVAAAPSETFIVFTTAPLLRTFMRSELPSTVEMC